MSVEENRKCNCEEENTVDCDLRRKMIQIETAIVWVI